MLIKRGHGLSWSPPARRTYRIARLPAVAAPPCSICVVLVGTLVLVLAGLAGPAGGIVD